MKTCKPISDGVRGLALARVATSSQPDARPIENRRDGAGVSHNRRRADDQSDQL